MSAPNKIYLVISNRRKVEFSAIKPPVLHVNERCYKVDEDIPLWDLMDWIAHGMPKEETYERIG